MTNYDMAHKWRQLHLFLPMLFPFQEQFMLSLTRVFFDDSDHGMRVMYE